MKIKNQDNLSTLIEMATKAICYLYKEDPTKPSLIISYLNNENFYVSVVRYRKGYAQDRCVVFKTQKRSLYSALITTAMWASKQTSSKTPVDELADFIAENDSSFSKIANEYM